MKIYTKTGDQGFTSLYTGKRVPKFHDRVETYGTVDELNSFVGLLRDQEMDKPLKNFLTQIQHQLFEIGSYLATDDNEKAASLLHIDEKVVENLEEEIDAMNNRLPAMTHFILPGGHTTVSYCHICRTICRRTERLLVGFNHNTPIAAEILQYFNRLSDYFFLLARFLIFELEIDEIKWIPKK